MKKCLYVTRITALSTFLVLASICSAASAQNMFRKVNDFDGDGKADLAVTRSVGGSKIWYLWQSAEGFATVQWGLSDDVEAAGDYDGDGKSDFAVYRRPTSFPSLYRYYVLESSTGAFKYTEFSSFGNFGSFPMHQDYDGDGKTDPAVWFGQFTQNTSIHILNSLTGIRTSTSVPPGNTAVRLGDLVGDSRAEKVYHTNNGNIVTVVNLATNDTSVFQFGVSGDDYLAADLDGDEKGDTTIFRASTGTWWWVRSSDNVVVAEQWGANGDVPVPADYDGDGITDLAVFRPGSPNSVYWVRQSSGGTAVYVWGIATDKPIRY